MYQKERKDMTEKEIKQYREFMYHKNNVRKCEGCPENEGFSNYQDRLPCGQYRCWVTVHCKGD